MILLVFLIKTNYNFKYRYFKRNLRKYVVNPLRGTWVFEIILFCCFSCCGGNPNMFYICFLLGPTDRFMKYVNYLWNYQRIDDGKEFG